MHRRRVVASVALVASAGCLGDLLSELTTYEAAPATVSEEALEEAGYDHRETRERVEQEEFGGQSVEVTNYVAEYARSIDLPLLGEVESGVFAAIATPRVTVAGEEFNPVGDADRAELVALAQDRYEGLSIGDSTGTRRVETLGRMTTVETFDGAATFAPTGDDVDLDVDVAAPDHGGDHLVLIGAYPSNAPEPPGGPTEARRVTTMIEGLEH